MAGFVKGEIVVTEDQREFICYKKIQDGKKNYLLMLSNFKPVEVFFAEEIIREDGTAYMRVVTDPAEKQRLAPLIKMCLPQSETRAPDEDQMPAPAPAPSPAPAPAEPEAPRTLEGEVSVEPLGVGDYITLENKGTYVCYRKVKHEGKEYLCLMSTAKPRQLLFGRESVDNGVLCVDIVKDAARHNALMKAVKKNPLDALKQIFVSRPKKT